AVPEIRKSLASLYNTLANYLIDYDVEERIRCQRRSERVLEEMGPMLTDADRWVLIGIQKNIGHTLNLLGRRAEALPVRLKVVEVAERLHADSPAVRTYRLVLAQTIGELGYLYLDEGRQRDAEAALRRAATMLEDIFKEQQLSASQRCPDRMLTNMHVALG